MRTLDRIISEQIDKFINEEFFVETEDDEKSPAQKRAEQERKDYEKKYGKKTDNPSYSEAYAFLKDDTTNLAAVADKLVDMGVLNCQKGPSAQSYLRKMTLELGAPNGGKYELHKNMVSAILKIKSEVAS